MTTEALQARIDALNPDAVDWNDPETYAALGVGKDEPGDEQGQQEQGDTAQAPAAAPAPAPAAAAPVAAPAPADSSQAPAAAPAPSEPARVDGVLAKDGKTVIPYGVLAAARNEARTAHQRAEAAEAALAEAQRQATAASSDLANRAAADPNSLTDAEMAELEQDFPALAKPLKLLRSMSEKLQTAAPTPAPAAPAPAPAASRSQGDDEAEAFDLAIAANPLIGDWMSSGGREWERAKAIDRVLQQDPESANLSYADRFAKVQRMVAAEFDIPLPKPAATPAAPAASPAAPAAPAVPAAKAAPLPSLSDLGGTPPQSAEDAVNGKSAADLLASTSGMSEEQLMRMAGVIY